MTHTGCILVLSLAAALSGCGGAAHSSGQRTMAVGERDFAVRAPARIAAGLVTVRSHNAGPDTHELIVVRMSGSRLPLRADGLTVDEHAIVGATVGSVADIAPGGTGHTRLRLTPGRYVLFCNMAGHYRGGMHTTLLVT